MIYQTLQGLFFFLSLLFFQFSIHKKNINNFHIVQINHLFSSSLVYPLSIYKKLSIFSSFQHLQIYMDEILNIGLKLYIAANINVLITVPLTVYYKNSAPILHLQIQTLIYYNCPSLPSDLNLHQFYNFASPQNFFLFPLVRSYLRNKFIIQADVQSDARY